MLEDDSVEIRILNIDPEQLDTKTLGTLKTGLNDDDDPLVSIQWEDNEANTEKEGKELVACNSQSVFLWDL